MCEGVTDRKKRIHRPFQTVLQVRIIKRTRFCPLDQQLEAESLPFSLFFTRSSRRSGSRFPQNKPPTGCLSRPLINPSVGSLLRPQPSEQGSNPAMQRLSSCRASEQDSQVLFHCSFLFQKKLSVYSHSCSLNVKIRAN